MKLSKIYNKLQYEEYCNQLIQNNKLDRQKFYNLDRIRQITNNNQCRWYLYIKKIQIKYNQQYKFKKQINSWQQIKKILDIKYNYYKQYQQLCCQQFTVKIVIKKIQQIQIIGHYFNTEYYIQNFICVIKKNDIKQVRVFNQTQFRKYIIQKKYTIQNIQQKNIKIYKNQIETFINNL